MIVIKQKMIYRVDLQANRHILYLFGDNLDRQGMGGQAGEMRDEPNGFGIATKRSISHNYPDDFFFDNQPDTISLIDKEFERLEQHIMMADYEAIIIPMDGLGTGLSRMPELAPKALAHLDKLLDGLGAY